MGEKEDLDMYCLQETHFRYEKTGEETRNGEKYTMITLSQEDMEYLC